MTAPVLPGWRRVAGRRFEETATGRTLSRRQYDKLAGRIEGSYEKKAASRLIAAETDARLRRKLAKQTARGRGRARTATERASRTSTISARSKTARLDQIARTHKLKSRINRKKKKGARAIRLRLQPQFDVIQAALRTARASKKFTEYMIFFQAHYADGRAGSYYLPGIRRIMRRMSEPFTRADFDDLMAVLQRGHASAAGEAITHVDAILHLHYRDRK